VAPKFKEVHFDYYMSPKSWASDRWPENLFTEKLPQIMENFMVANGMNYSINNQLQLKIFLRENFSSELPIPFGNSEKEMWT